MDLAAVVAVTGAATGMGRAPFHEEPDEVSRREVGVPLLGTATGSRLALQRMLSRRSGHVANVPSDVGRVPLPGSAMYSATEHASSA